MVDVIKSKEVSILAIPLCFYFYIKMPQWEIGQLPSGVPVASIPLQFKNQFFGNPQLQYGLWGRLHQQNSKLGVCFHEEYSFNFSAIIYWKRKAFGFRLREMYRYIWALYPLIRLSVKDYVI